MGDEQTRDPEQESQSASPQRVLLVDDSEDLLEVYCLGLEEEGYKVDIATSGKDALRLLEDTHPDVVVTDVSMPGMSGLELLTRIRSDLAPPVPPVVVISGFRDAEEEALERGAWGFVLKPILLEELYAVVRTALEGKDERRRRPSEHKLRLRARTRHIAQATLNAALEHEDVLSRCKRAARWLSTYIGHSFALLLAPRGDDLEVVVSSDPDRYPLGQPDDHILELSNDVLESGAKLLITDVAAAMRFIHDRSSTIRFVACVPFTIGRVPVATLCLVDDAAHEFDSTEVRLLEEMARSASDALATPGAPRWFDLDSGLFSRKATSIIIESLWRQAAARKRSAGIHLVRTTGLPDDGSAGTLLDELPGPRMAIGALDRSTIVICASAESRRELGERFDVIQDQVADRFEIEECSRIVFESPLPDLSPGTLLSWAKDLLDSDEPHRPCTEVSVVSRNDAERPDA